MSKQVCLCKHVSRESIKKAIDHGTTTLEGVKAATGASLGACKGERCKNEIHRMLKEKEQSTSTKYLFRKGYCEMAMPFLFKKRDYLRALR